MCCVQAAMMNWGKQSAFDMFSNLMTFQALASQQGQVQETPAVALGSPTGILPVLYLTIVCSSLCNAGATAALHIQ